jgi:hypothetical protein
MSKGCGGAAMHQLDAEDSREKAAALSEVPSHFPLAACSLSICGFSMCARLEGIRRSLLDCFIFIPCVMLLCCGELVQEGFAPRMQSEDIDMSEVDVTDIETLKKRGHMQMAAGQVRWCRAHPSLNAHGHITATVSPLCIFRDPVPTFFCAIVQFENAINAYSLALKVARDSREEARLLSNRSEAFSRYGLAVL